MTFYRKHRPRIIDELDLTSVRNSMIELAGSLEDIPHAYLFSGPRGAGKTSAARILAKLVNCESPVSVESADGKYFEPCNECSQCRAIDRGSSMDVIEMDAASNRGIDDIRALRENVSLAPSSAKKKIYIMDEAHMLTNEAANAFLKTLEEPPSHVIFILATTDPQKLPETIHSRLRQISFKKATTQELKRQLARVAKNENMDLAEEVIDLIIDNSDGSFRDAVKALEALSSLKGKVELEVAKQKLDLVHLASYEKFASLLAARKHKEAISELGLYVDARGSVKDLIDKLLAEYRKSLLATAGVMDYEDYDLTKKELMSLISLLFEARENIRKTPLPELALEIAIIKWAGEKVEEVKKKPKIKKIVSDSGEVALDEVAWTKVLSNMRSKNASIETLLRASKPKGIEGNVFKLGVYYRFHKEKLENKECKRALEDVVSEVLNTGPLRLVCSLEERKEPFVATPDKPLTDSAEEDIISAAKEIFGG